jgi:hypothetical protein
VLAPAISPLSFSALRLQILCDGLKDLFCVVAQTQSALRQLTIALSDAAGQRHAINVCSTDGVLSRFH